MAAVCCCLGDTLASELAPLYPTPVYLVTQPWRRVPRGTNGGVTPQGIALSALGGALPALVFALLSQLPLGCWTLYGLGAGLFGSLLDSVLGAVLQETRVYEKRDVIVPETETETAGTRWVAGRAVLTNSLVNFISSSATAGVFAYINF